MDQPPKYHVKILLADFNEKVGRDDIFKPTIGDERLHEISSGSGVRVMKLSVQKI
jgi:hypothetical protein